MPNWTVNCASNGSFQLADSNTVGATAIVTLTKGTLDTNGKTCSWGALINTGASTRTLTLGSSPITLTGANTVLSARWSAMTWTANTATFTASGASATIELNSSSTSGNVNGSSFVLTGSGIAVVHGYGCTMAAVTRTGTAVKTDGLTLGGIGTPATLTITGALTLNSNSSTNRLLVTSGVIGTAQTVSAASLTATNVIDFMDITGSGAATWTTGASGATSFGDCQGNSGITFTTPATQTWSGNTTGSWSNSANWTSRVPLPQDDVTINGLTSGTITTDMPRLGHSIDATSSTGVWNASSNAINIFGSLTIPSGMTGTWNQIISLSGRSSQTLGIQGVTLTGAMTIFAPGGTYTLTADLTWVTSVNSQGLTFQYGTFTASTFNVTVGSCGFLNNNTKTLNMGSGTWTLMSQNGWVGQASGFGATLNAQTSTMLITGHNQGVGAWSFTGGSQTYNIVHFTNTAWNGAATQVSGVTAAYTISGVSTFNTLIVDSGAQVAVPAATTQTITTLTALGQTNSYQYQPGFSGQYISTPNAAPLQITGNITIDCKVALTSWTTAQTLVGKWAASNQNSYLLQIVAGGALKLSVSTTGSDSPNASSSAATGFSAGTTNWVRASFTVGSPGTVNFYTSSNGSTWNQLGTSQSLTAASIFNSSSLVEVGSTTTGTASLAIGKFYQARLYNSALGSGSGTAVFDANFATKAFGVNTFAESSSNAATVTINGGLAQVGDGRIQLVSGTPTSQATLTSANKQSVDYFTIQDSKVDTSPKWYAGANSVNVSNNTNWIFTAPPALGGTMLLMGV
jgi:hypothetical protein